MAAAHLAAGGAGADFSEFLAGNSPSRAIERRQPDRAPSCTQTDGVSARLLRRACLAWHRFRGSPRAIASREAPQSETTGAGRRANHRPASRDRGDPQPCGTATEAFSATARLEPFVTCVPVSNWERSPQAGRTGKLPATRFYGRGQVPSISEGRSPRRARRPPPLTWSIFGSV